MGRLHRFGHDLGRWNVEEASLVAERVAHPHLGNDLDGLAPLVVNGGAIDFERVLLHTSDRRRGAPVDPSLRQNVERRDPLGDANRVVVPKWQQRASMADADAFRPRGDERQKGLRRGRVRVLVQPVMLDLPDAVKTELVGQDRLLDTFVEQPRLFGGRRIPQLHFEEQRELHVGSISGKAAISSRCPRTTASSAGLGASSSTPRSSSMPKASRTRFASRIAFSESPPSSKKSSSNSTAATSRTSPNTRQSVSSSL